MGSAQILFAGKRGRQQTRAMLSFPEWAQARRCPLPGGPAPGSSAKMHKRALPRMRVPGPGDMLVLPWERGPRALFSFPQSTMHRADPEPVACAGKEGRARASWEGASLLGELRASLPGAPSQPVLPRNAERGGCCVQRMTWPLWFVQRPGSSLGLSGLSRQLDTDMDIWLQEMSCSFQERLLGGGRGGGGDRA